jgi:5-methylcytosine-specific restriction endonuclease McrA
VKRRRPRCYLCGQYLPELRARSYGDLVHLDHIVPLAEGGTHTRLNVTLVHAKCNQKKHAQITDRLPGERGPLPSDHPLGFQPIEFPPVHLRKPRK